MTRRRTLHLIPTRISQRIAIAMVLSLVAIQMQAFTQLRYFYKPQLHLVGTLWLASAVVNSAEAAFAVPAGQRVAALAALPQRDRLDRRWSPARPVMRQGGSSPEIWASLAANVRAALGARVRSVEVGGTPLGAKFPVSQIQLSYDPGEMQGGYPAAAAGTSQPESLVPANVGVLIQGLDGSWLYVAPLSNSTRGSIGGAPFAPLIMGGLLIAFFSVVIARAIVAPLNRLVDAAGRIGSMREIVPVPTQGLGEFKPVAEAFDDMQRRLLKIVEDRTIILAAISHDLKSSLTRLRIAIESKSEADIRRATEKELHDMESMLESTLSFATGDIQRGPMQTIDIAALLISLVDDAIDAGADASYAGPDHLELEGQPVALRRAYRNLIDNALKYGGCARVALEVGDEQAQVRIEDAGPGIPAERVDEAFAPFRRLDPARTGAIPGAGLGMTIARDVLLNHGGTIVLSAADAGGLRVLTALPRRQLRADQRDEKAERVR